MAKKGPESRDKGTKGIRNKGGKRRRESAIEEELEEVHSAIDGKYGWFVVFNAFVCNMIVDGMQYTFANFLVPISEDMSRSIAETSLIGSLLSGFYNFSGPIAGALGNKFGFRMVIITGSMVSGSGLMLSYFAPNMAYLYFFYGILGGLGFGMIYMASVIMTSLYFEKYRALAASLAVCGTGVGTFLFSPMGSCLVEYWGWKYALVTEGGIVFLCILSGLAYKPLKLEGVIPVTRQASVDSSYSETTVRRGSMYYPTEGRRGSTYYPTEGKRALPNEAYPTFKEALYEGYESRRGTITSLAARSVKGSVVSAGNYRLPIYSNVPEPDTDEVKAVGRRKKIKQCCRICCFNFWHCRCKQEELNLGDRPLYRDDIFYGGSLSTLDAYDPGEPVNYHLSVTRVPNAEELQQHAARKCCVCHPAVLRTCVTMTGLHLLRSKVFVFLCISSFFYTMSLYIPFVFVRKLATQYNIPNEQAVWMLSAIGIANTAGRLLSGIIKSFLKINTTLLVFGCLVVSAVACFVFLFVIDLPSICVFSCLFGLFTAPFISLRPVIIVEFLGLEKLTNAFGLVLLCQGVASIIGPPIAGVLEERTKNDEYVIYLSGGLLFLSSAALLVSVIMHRRETRI